MAIFLGLGISSYFSAPAMLEKNYVCIDNLTAKWFDFHGHFINFSQVFFSPWGYDVTSKGKGFSFQIGWPHWACFFAFFFMAPLLWKKCKESVLVAIFSALIAFSAIFMSLRPSTFIWDHIPLLQFCQFPWRFLNIPVFFICFVGGSVRIYQRHPEPVNFREYFIGIHGFLEYQGLSSIRF